MTSSFMQVSLRYCGSRGSSNLLEEWEASEGLIEEAVQRSGTGVTEEGATRLLGEAVRS